MRPTGLTRNAGWQIGVSRTFPVDLDAAWEFVVSPAGLAIWLGEVAQPLTNGAAYVTADGTRGDVRSLRARDRVRLTWQPPGRERPATIQVAVTEASNRSTIRFHTEHLVSEDERNRFRERWRGVLDRIEAEFS